MGYALSLPQNSARLVTSVINDHDRLFKRYLDKCYENGEELLGDHAYHFIDPEYRSLQINAGLITPQEGENYPFSLCIYECDKEDCAVTRTVIFVHFS